MKIITKKHIFAALALAVPLFLQASGQDVPSKVSLSLEQAQEYALEHNNTIRNASVDVRKAQAAKWQAVASMLPQIAASVDYSNYFGYKMDLGMMKLAMTPYASMGVTTSMSFSGASIVSLQVADISRRMADISLMQSRQQISSQVRVLYFSALATEETLRLLQDNLESLRKLHSMSQKSVEVGISEQTAADQILVQVNTMENTISSTRRSLEMVYNSMRLLLNLPAETEISLLDGLDDLINLAYAESLSGEEFDIEDNYNWRLLKESTELARKQISLTGWSRGPTVSIYHQYSSRHNFSDEVTMNMTPPNMLGVQLRVPLFTSGLNSAAVRDARLSYEKQLNTLEETALALGVQHSQLVYNLRSALERYSTQHQNMEVAQRVFDNIAEKYRHGISSSLDVTNSGTNLIAAQSAYVQALLEIINAQAALEELMNK